MIYFIFIPVIPAIAGFGAGTAGVAGTVGPSEAIGAGATPWVEGGSGSPLGSPAGILGTLGIFGLGKPRRPGNFG
jgi:hypothetical protein